MGMKPVVRHRLSGSYFRYSPIMPVHNEQTWYIVYASTVVARWLRELKVAEPDDGIFEVPESMLLVLKLKYGGEQCRSMI
jgi:hypothetical protein